MSTRERWDLIVYILLPLAFTLSVTIWFLVADVFWRIFIYVGLIVVFLNVDFLLASYGKGFLGIWAVFLALALLSASTFYGVGYGLSYFVSYATLILLWLKMFPETSGPLRNVEWKYVVGASFLAAFILGFLGFEGASMVVLSPLWEFLVWKSLGGEKSLAKAAASSLFSSSTLIVYPAILVYSVFSGIFKWKAKIGLSTVLALDVALKTSIAVGWLLWMRESLF